MLAIVPVACALLTGEAMAQPRSAERAASAEALFREGKALMDDGVYQSACPKLEASQRLDPAVGTLLNLAICHEKVNRTASAWANYLRAASMARSRGQAEREQYARAKAAALEPRLTRLALAVDERAIVDGFVIKRDGIMLESATWATATPVDPGSHVISAAAPGKEGWQTTVDVAGEGKTFTVDVPVLEDAPPEAAPEAPVAAAPVAPPPPAAEAPPASFSSGWQRTAGLVVGGVGLTGLVVGSIFGLQARSKWNDASCPGNVCVSEADQTRAEDAKQFSTISTWGFAAGGALIAAGAVLWMTAPNHTGRREVGDSGAMVLRVIPTAGNGAAGMLVHGDF